MVTKQELSNTVFKSVFVPILIYVREARVMTEGVLPQVQAAEMFFLQKVHRVILSGQVLLGLLARYPSRGGKLI